MCMCLCVYVCGFLPRQNENWNPTIRHTCLTRTFGDRTQLLHFVCAKEPEVSSGPSFFEICILEKLMRLVCRILKCLLCFQHVLFC